MNLVWILICISIVSQLISRGANVNHSYKTKKELSRYSCELDITHFKRTPLMHAAQHADSKMIELLIKHGADPDQSDSLGERASDYAVRAKKRKNEEYLNSL